MHSSEQKFASVAIIANTLLSFAKVKEPVRAAIRNTQRHSMITVGNQKRRKWKVETANMRNRKPVKRKRKSESLTNDALTSNAAALAFASINLNLADVAEERECLERRDDLDFTECESVFAHPCEFLEPINRSAAISHEVTSRLYRDPYRLRAKCKASLHQGTPFSLVNLLPCLLPCDSFVGQTVTAVNSMSIPRFIRSDQLRSAHRSNTIPYKKSLQTSKCLYP
ncbi:hypothetical protein pdam_00011562 [Pocillopora damicornis]|uniref:Uncharacterized protein n=1 Tax=Pocillopora damicornis TaxID=46731 RepID=A0A3M6TI27_POCDA|nr:hypothetical protein pdam_00011562 [Pocillopora damicornis]